jgi:hypothetical protein
MNAKVFHMGAIKDEIRLSAPQAGSLDSKGIPFNNLFKSLLVDFLDSWKFQVRIVQ